MDDPSKLPYVIQMTEAPCFRCDGPDHEHLYCDTGCGNILIENYDEGNFYSIGIKCFRCGRINFTPNLEPGEVFGASILSLGDAGQYLLSKTVDLPPGSIVTCASELERERLFSFPRDMSRSLDVTDFGIQSLIDEYDRIVGNRFSVQEKIVSKSGNSRAIEFPFAWSVSHIRHELGRGELNIRQRETRVSLMWLSTFNHIISTWSHHPRFASVAKDLGKPHSFLHTASQFNIAHYLFSAGNRIGLSLENKHGEPNPDLYIRGPFGSRAYLEVKAPSALQWVTGPVPDPAKIEKSVKRLIQDSVGQINRSRKGVLAIYSNYDFPNSSECLEKEISKTLMLTGRQRKYLAAVVGLTATSSFNFDDGKIVSNVGFEVSVTINPHFEGKNPIITTPRATATDSAQRI